MDQSEVSTWLSTNQRRALGSRPIPAHLLGGDGHRVEVAEAHGLLRLGVVAGGPHYAEPVLKKKRYIRTEHYIANVLFDPSGHLQLVGGDPPDELHHGAGRVPAPIRGEHGVT